MSRRNLICDFIERSNTCRLTEELLDIFEVFLTKIGVDIFSYAQLTSDAPCKLLEIRDNFPESWRRHYGEMNYAQVDPRLRISNARQGIFLWDDAAELLCLSKRERRLFVEMEAAGIKAGLTISLQLGNGPLGCLNLASTGDQTWQRDRLSLAYAMASQFQLAYTTLNRDASFGTVALSDRQREVLQWAAAGKSRSSIGQIMGISEGTVDDHFRHIFRKLSCNDRVVAVVKAISLGLILPVHMQ